MKKGLIALAALVALVCTSCKNSKTLTIGSIIYDANNEWFVEAIAGMQGAAKDNNCTLVLQDSHYDANVEKDMIREQLKNKANAIVICPLSTDETGRALAEAASFQIPVVTWNTVVEPAPTTQVVVDATELGRATGEYLVDYMREHDIASLKAALITDRSFSIGIERCDGFRNAIQPLVDDGKIEILYDTPGQLAEQIKVNVKKILAERPDIQFIWCWHQMSLIATIDVLKELGRTDILVAGTDMSVGLARDMLGSEVQLIAVTTQLPYELGYQAVANAVKAAHGEKTPASISIPTYTYIKEDVAALKEYVSTHEKFLK